MGLIGDVGAILIGLVLLFLGRRFFWMAAGLVGFLFGYNILQHFVGIWWLNLIVGLILGGMLAWLATKFIKLVSYFVGALAGAVLLPLLLGFLGIPFNWFVMVLIGALAGLLFISVAFSWGLIILSALMGASIVSQNIADIFSLNQGVKSIVGLILLVLGVVIQAGQRDT